MASGFTTPRSVPDNIRLLKFSRDGPTAGNMLIFFRWVSFSSSWSQVLFLIPLRLISMILSTNFFIKGKGTSSGRSGAISTSMTIQLAPLQLQELSVHKSLPRETNPAVILQEL